MTISNNYGGFEIGFGYDFDYDVNKNFNVNLNADTRATWEFQKYEVKDVNKDIDIDVDVTSDVNVEDYGAEVDFAIEDVAWGYNPGYQIEAVSDAEQGVSTTSYADSLGASVTGLGFSSYGALTQMNITAEYYDVGFGQGSFVSGEVDSYAS